MEFFESLGVDMEASDMSFSVSLDKGQGYEWGSRNGLSSLFAQKANVLNPSFWQMLREIIKFKHDVLRQAILFQTWDMISSFWRRKIYMTALSRMSWEKEMEIGIKLILYIFIAVILMCLRTTRTLIAMRPWDSSSSHGVTLNCLRKLILWDSYSTVLCYILKPFQLNL